MKLMDCYNIHELEKMARKHLPDPMFHYLAGGADDEVSLRRNSAAFQDYEIMPYSLRDVSNIDTSCTILGAPSKLPFFLAPTGMNRLFHHDKEFAAAKAAQKKGIPYSLSTVATTSIEDIGNTISSPKMLQLYIHKDRSLTTSLMQRAKQAGYSSICLTVDTLVAGNRERDLVTGMNLPPKLTLKSIVSFLSHSYWLRHAHINKGFELSNLTDFIDRDEMAGKSVAGYINDQFDRTLTWKDLEWLRGKWDGHLVIKGIQNADDAATAEKIGAESIIVSNHGGRQLDCSPAPVDCIQKIKDTTTGKSQIIIDGGIKRGTDIFKALALGADAVAIGRAYLYGLAAGGTEGVEQAITILENELVRAMQLSGCQKLSDLSPAMINKIYK